MVTNDEQEKETLAMEIMRELKHSAKRWFIIAIVELGVILAMSGIFFWYISLPVEENVITQESDNDSYNQVIGGDVNGIEADNTENTESGKD